MRRRYEEENLALVAGTRTIYFSSLTYGGTDQMTVSTVHLARELNVLNMACDTLSVDAKIVPCPFAFVNPIVRDLTPAAKANAMYLFSEPSRPEVPLHSLFDLDTMRACSRMRIIPGISALRQPERERTVIPTHVVLPFNFYGGPVLSHTSFASTAALLNNLSYAYGSVEQLRRIISAFNKTVENFVKAAGRYKQQAGIELRISRYTVLPDPPKSGTTHEWKGGPEHMCSPPGAEMKDKDHYEAKGCGSAFLQQMARHEPNGTLVLFIVTESSQQNDIPSRKSFRYYWHPSGQVNRTLLIRYRVDERAVTECLKLAPRFDQAVSKMFELSGVSLPIAAWQLRAEKLSLAVSKKKKEPHPSTYQSELSKSIHQQVRSLQSSTSICGVRTILWESDLLRPSSTMLNTIFGAKFNSSAGTAQLQRLRDGVLRGLRTRPKGMTKAKDKGTPARITTTDAMLAACKSSVPAGHPLERFVRGDSSLLNVERTLFAITVMVHATYLIRSPVTSSFSGWANTIRVASGGPSAASWGTDDGSKWWKCDVTSHVKMGKCRRPNKTERAPHLCQKGSPAGGH